MQEETQIINNEEARGLGIRRKYFWIMINTILIFIIILLGYFAYRAVQGKGFSASLPKFKKEEQSKPSVVLVPRTIDGIMVMPGQENPYPLAFMIDNTPEARPQAGLSSASLVIESEAEGGVTRYLAVIAASDLPEKIGPIRSARPYFIDWANEFSAAYVHCGGSPDALNKITRDGIVDLNEFYSAETFWREESRAAPHNVYTKKDLILNHLSGKGLDQGKFFGYNYKTDEDQALRPVSSEIYIPYKLKGFKVTWRYDQAQNDYIRFLDNQEYKEENGTIIRAKNIIIQVADAKELDDKLRLDMTIIGEGKATICLDGRCQEGKWKKKNSSTRTRFYDQNDQEISFNRGKTWIEVVRPEIEVKISD